MLTKMLITRSRIYTPNSKDDLQIIQSHLKTSIKQDGRSTRPRVNYASVAAKNKRIRGS